MKALAFLLLFAARVWAANCGGTCISGHASVTGANGFQIPNTCVCDWEIPTNQNWALLNGTGFLPAGITPNTGVDQTGAIQTVIDSGRSPFVWPAGTFLACGLIPRSLNQVWIGAGKHQTILQITPGCTSLILLSATSGPANYWEISGMTLKSNGTANTTLINEDGGSILRGNIHDNAFDVGSGYALGGTGATAIAWSGGSELNIERNEIYSVLPGYGNGINLFRAARTTRVLNNTWHWIFTGLQLASVQGTEDIDIGDNIGDLGWYALPAKYTGTANYAATTLTDLSSNSFTALCADAGTPGTCAAGTGNFVRVMTPVVTGTAAATFFAPGLIGDSGISTASVFRGQLVRSAPVCRGNGNLGQTKRHSCSAGSGSGTGQLGDGCACASNADCGSAICQARFATVMGVVDGTHIAIDEWTSDVDRRPTGAPVDGTAYTVFSWLMGQVASYTSTVITIATGTSGWHDWFGTATTPTNGATYEVMTKHPNYQILVGASTPVVQKARIHDCTLTRGHSDQCGLNSGSNWIVSGNQISDGQDEGITVDGSANLIVNNVIDHQGTSCIFDGGNDVIIDNNICQNPTWTNSANTLTLGCITAFAGNRAMIRGNKCLVTIAMALNRYGLAVGGTTDSVQFVDNTFQGMFTVGQYRLNGASATNVHIVNYNGETISNSSGTFSIQGGLSTEAALTANAAQNGSYSGCSDCTVASPCAASGTGAMAKRQGGAWVCN